MTEVEWLTDSNYTQMLRFVHARTTVRQARLCMVACCRSSNVALADSRIPLILEAAERCADHPGAEVVVKAYQWRRAFAREPRTPQTGRWKWLGQAIADAHHQLDSCRTEGTWDGTRHRSPGAALSHASYMSLREEPLEIFTGGEGNAVVYCACLVDRAEVLRLREKPGQSLYEIDEAKERIRAVLADIFRDVFGNPFRPVAFEPAWRTDTTVSLARTMYDSRDFGAMPILADALQDAGCDNVAVLTHCRDTKQVHVRGCWVVDLVLGKG